MQFEHRMELFACRASKDFAAKVVDELNALLPEGEERIHLGSSEVDQFSDGNSSRDSPRAYEEPPYSFFNPHLLLARI